MFHLSSKENGERKLADWGAMVNDPEVEIFTGWLVLITKVSAKISIPAVELVTRLSAQSAVGHEPR